MTRLKLEIPGGLELCHCREGCVEGATRKSVESLLLKNGAPEQPRNERALSIALSTLETAMEAIIRSRGDAKNSHESETPGSAQ